jgi:hypothetical protein
MDRIEGILGQLDQFQAGIPANLLFRSSRDYYRAAFESMGRSSKLMRGGSRVVGTMDTSHYGDPANVQVYFDLESRRGRFNQQFQGLVIAEPTDSQIALNHIYNTRWQRG